MPVVHKTVGFVKELLRGVKQKSPISTGRIKWGYDLMVQGSVVKGTEEENIGNLRNWLKLKE